MQRVICHKTNQPTNQPTNKLKRFSLSYLMNWITVWIEINSCRWQIFLYICMWLNYFSNFFFSKLNFFVSFSATFWTKKSWKKTMPYGIFPWYLAHDKEKKTTHQWNIFLIRDTVGMVNLLVFPLPLPNDQTSYFHSNEKSCLSTAVAKSSFQSYHVPTLPFLFFFF